MSTSLVKSEQTHRLGQNEAGVRLAEAALELARLNLSYTVIIAPCDGTTGKKEILEGQLVQPGQTMMINIYGGNNLIAPVASSAIQNFYGDRGDEAADQPEDSEKTESTESVTDEKPAQEPAELSDDEFYVSVYIPDIKVMRAYKILLGECTTARELAVVVGKMLADENCRNVDKHTVVKAAFIKSLLPFAKRLVSGGTIANIRAQINNMLASK